MREQTFLESGDKNGVEFEAFGGVHRHELQRGTPLGRLGLARFERRVHEKGSQRIEHFIADRALGFADEAVRGTHQFLKIFNAFLPVLLCRVVREQPACVNHVLDRLW